MIAAPQPRAVERAWSTDPNFGIEQFIYCLVLHMLAPVAAIIPIALARGKLDSLDLGLTVILYLIALAIHARDRIFRFLLFCGVVIFAFWIGMNANANGDFPMLSVVSWAALGLVFFVHLFERWDRHVVGGEAFFHK